MKKFISVLLAFTMVCSMAITSFAAEGTTEEASEPEEIIEADEADEDSDASDAEDRALTIGLALPDLATNATFIEMQEAIQEICDERGYTLMPVDTKGDTAVLIETLENFISAKCDVVILSNFAEEACEDLFQQMLDDGVVIGSYDYTSDYAQYAIYSSNYDLGYDLGQMAGEWANEHDGSKKLAVLTVSFLDFLVTRTEGIEDGFMDACPDGEVVAVQEGSSTAEAVESTENILQSDPDVQVICGIGDNAALGAYEACKAAGKSYENDGIAIFGIDGSDDGLNAIQEDDMFKGTIYLDLTNQMTQLFERCCETALTGEVDEENAEVPYPSILIYLDNIEDAQ